jgi:glycosyltransferase involved in cell wall biosynthesis
VKVFYNLLADVRRSAVPNNDSRASEETSRQAIDAWLDGSYLIVYTGRLHEQKGPHVLVKAIEELVNRRGRRLQLLMLGNGPAEQEIREFITAHRLEANIRLMGFVEDPRTWYQRAQLFVMPSYFEGMPNALIEAVAAGLPAVSSNCHSGPGEILDEGRCGRLVQPGDPIALADGIADAMDHPDDCKTKADAARARVLQMFDPVEGMRRLEELFVSIVQGSTKKPPQAVR